jgi:hypothetical protein
MPLPETEGELPNPLRGFRASLPLITGKTSTKCCDAVAMFVDGFATPLPDGCPTVGQRLPGCRDIRGLRINGLCGRVEWDVCGSGDVI